MGLIDLLERRQVIYNYLKMKNSIKIINNYEYKKLFLPDVSEHNLFNESKIQVYRIENYLRSILMPVIPYRTTFNFLFS